MESATAIAELRPVVEAQATAIAQISHNVGELGYAVISLDAHLQLITTVFVALLLFDRVIGYLWVRVRRVSGFEGR